MKINNSGILHGLKSLQKQGYIFRGQPSKKFPLIPNAFRPDGIAKLSDQFPDPQQWRHCTPLKELVHLYAKGLSIDHTWIQRLFDITIHTMQYNHKLMTYTRSVLNLGFTVTPYQNLHS